MHYLRCDWITASMTVHVANSWLFLVVAIVFGALGTIFIKLSSGLQKLVPTIFLLLCYGISFITMTFAMREISLSIVYAIWSGVGTVLVAFVGIVFFHESASLQKVFFLLLIIVGVIGIHVNGNAP